MIPTARTTKLSLTEFRRRVAVLKKHGIVDVDARKAQPYYVRKAGPRGGTYFLSELVDKYDDVISGKSTPVKLSPEKTKAYKRLGYQEIKGGKILVPHAATEKVRVKKGDIQIVDSVAGIERLPIPVEYHNLEQYLQDLRENEDEIRAMRKGNRFFAFRFFGGHSQLYDDIDLLLDDLEHYSSVMQSINNQDSRSMNEIYRNLEIVTVNRRAWKTSQNVSRQKARSKSRNKPHARKRRLDKLKSGPKWKLDQYREKRAEESRQYRLKLTGSAKEEYKKDAAKRAKKSRKK